jgi:UDP-glucose 4-epimerase
MAQGVLVTGGAGFIGSHVIAALLAGGSRVRVLDDLSTGALENLPATLPASDLVVGDVRDPAAVARAVRGCDRVVHLAAIASVSRSTEDPATTAAVNVGGTANVLAAARAAGVRRLVFASSCAVYGSTTDLPVAETARPHPESPYAASKLRGEELCRDRRATGGVEACALRFFNVYGPRQDPSSEYSGVIAIFMDRLSSGRSCVVHGDGRQTRDFVFVRDVASACRAALDGPAPGPGPFNVGTGVETSLLDVLSALARASGREPVIEYGAPRPGDITRSCADCGRARRALGHRPSVGLVDGLAATWSWYLGAAAQGAAPGRGGGTAG